MADEPSAWGKLFLKLVEALGISTPQGQILLKLEVILCFVFLGALSILLATSFIDVLIAIFSHRETNNGPALVLLISGMVGILTLSLIFVFIRESVVSRPR